MCKAKVNNLSKFSRLYPGELISALRVIAELEGKQFYVVGGTVRDLLLGKSSNDLDLAVSEGAVEIVRALIRQLGGGAFVDLCGADDEAARLVWHNIQVDIASFREGAGTIEEDLALRDFTINSLGVKLDQLIEPGDPPEIIDPTTGFADLTSCRLRHCPSAFTADPVRMLRGYRLHAVLNFSLVEETEQEIEKCASLLDRVAAERIRYELDLIFDSSRTAATLREMDKSGLLKELLPELYRGQGVLQPRFHHLDVFKHNMLALEMMETIVVNPGKFFPGQDHRLKEYLQEKSVIRWLKWAALLHDLGKPATRGESEKEAGRVTFYGHDEVGRQLFCNFAEQLRWSRRDRENVAALIGMHMHPFHLCNIERKGEVTKRAALKLCQRAGDLLPGLFLLAMADSLAGQGEKKPVGMEKEIAALLGKVLDIYEENIRPVLSGPRLLTGRDLIDSFDLHPGPLFSTIFARLEVARVEGEVANREQAMVWVDNFLQKQLQAEDRETGEKRGVPGVPLVKGK
ncbi:MAG: HD domain-containing protein [Deltaproteobacteria bacterium]|nr:HD domain-containing protein [Deltaproteobacteria bacterium]